MIKITRVSDNGNAASGGLCLKRESTRMEFSSGAWVEITRYTYADGIVISAVGKITSHNADYAPYSWGQVHRFEKFA